MMTVQVRIKITHHLDYCLSSITTEWDMEVKTVGLLSVLLFQHLKSWRNYYHRKVRIEKQGCTTTTGYSLVQDKLTIQWQFPIQEIFIITHIPATFRHTNLYHIIYIIIHNCFIFVYTHFIYKGLQCFYIPFLHFDE